MGSFTIDGVKPKKVNINGEKCKKVTVNGTTVWTAVPDYIYNGGWADSDIITAGSLSNSVLAYSVAPNPVTNTVTVCKIDVTDIATISGNFYVNWEQVDAGTVGHALSLVKLDGRQIGYYVHTNGSVWDGSHIFSVDVSAMTGWKTLTLELTTTVTQGSSSMNGGSGARVRGSTSISVINCTAL